MSKLNGFLKNQAKNPEQATCNYPKAQFKRLSVFMTTRNFFIAMPFPKPYTQANLLPHPLGKEGVEKKTNNPQTDCLTERLLNQHHANVSGHLVYQSRGALLLLFLTPFSPQHPRPLHCTSTETLLPVQGTRSC